MRTRSEVFSMPFFDDGYSTRMRTMSGTGESARPLPPNSYCANHYPSALSVQTRFEAASDLSDTRTLGQWNAFDHYLRRYVSPLDNSSPLRYGVSYWTTGYPAYDELTTTDPLWGYSSVSGFGSVDNPTVGLPSLFVSKETGSFIPDPSGLNDLIAQSLQTMLQGERSQLSILNSIYELKDFRSLPDTLLRLKTLVSKVKNLNLHRPLSQVLNASSDVFLQTEFNVLPLVSDLSNIWNSLRASFARIEKLIQREGLIESRHFARDLGAPYTDSVKKSAAYNTSKACTWYRSRIFSSPIRDPRFIGQSRTTRTVTYTKRRFHAEIEYSVKFLDIQKHYYALFALLDRLGVQLNPQVIWNAIPWTFLLDWFIDVGRYLSQYKLVNTEPVIVIHRYLYSVSVDRIIRLSVESGDTGLPSRVRQTRQIVVTESAYTRRVGFSNDMLTHSLDAGPALSGMKVLLASALALPRVIRRLKPRW